MLISKFFRVHAENNVDNSAQFVDIVLILFFLMRLPCSVVKKYDTFTPDLEDMCDYVMSQGVDTVAMESTGIYISALRTVLRRHKERAVVVNPFLIKQMPGRKSDVKDSVWIATLMYNGMLNDSFLPDGVLAQLRVYTREYRRSVQRRDSTLTLIDQLLVGMGIRLSSCLSKITTKSFRRVAEALAGGETRPDELEKLVHGCLKYKRDGTLRKALTGCCGDMDLWRLGRKMEELCLYERQVEDAKKHMEELAEANYREEVALLCTIPGVSRISAICIIAEIGVDMSQFGSSARLTGWAGLRPRNDESAGKYKSTAITKGNKHLKAMLVQCAWGAVRARNSRFGSVFSRLSSRKSAKKAIVAVARKLLTTIFAMLKKHEQYCPQKTGRTLTASQMERLIKLRARQFDRLCLQAKEAGVSDDKIRKMTQP